MLNLTSSSLTRTLRTEDGSVFGAPEMMPPDLRTILNDDYFAHRGFPNEISTADNLKQLVAQVVFDHVEFFSLKLSKGLDNYPTVTIKVKGDKKNNVSEEEYLKRFKVHYY